jgi:integrase
MGYKKLEDGTFLVWYCKRDPITRVPTKLQRKGIKSEAEAKRVFNQLVVEVEEKLKKKTTPTWWKTVEAYFDYARLKGIHEKTIQNYFLGLQAYTKSIWGERLIDSITTAEIVKLITVDMAAKTTTNKQSQLKFIRAVFEYALETNIVNRNPCPRLKLEVKDKVKRGLTETQLSTLLEQAKIMGCEWYEIWATAAYTGMRNGELYALTWDKVDLENRRIVVDTSWNKVDGFKSTKSGHERIVEIAPILVTILRELKIADPSSHFVLPRLPEWERGHQAAELRLFMIGLGLPRIKFHDFRALTCSMLLAKGVPMYKVMAMLGWRDLKTASIYLRMNGETVKGITNNLNLHNPKVESNGEILPFVGKTPKG